MAHYQKALMGIIVVLLLFSMGTQGYANQDIIKIGLNYPQSGPYAREGKDQWYAAEIARKEINDAGGILGKKVSYRWMNSESNPGRTKANLSAAISRDKIKMAFGGSSSAVAIAAGEICRKNNVLFFGTLTYSTSTTAEAGNKTLFRECYNSWMAAKAISSHLRKHYPNAKYFYITADYTWGWTTEASMRTFTGTGDKSKHPGILTPFPSGYYDEALEAAKAANPDVLVLVLFGNDMATAIRKADEMGLKSRMQIVVPNLTLTMAERGTPKSMAGVIGALPWCWKVPYKYDYKEGIKFVEKFKKRFNRYPSTSAASAYTIMHQYKAAVERAGTFDTNAVIKELEGHEYQLLKDKQRWRAFDHQSVQTVYTVRCNPADVVLANKYNLDYFEIIGQLSGERAVRTRSQWNAVRKAAGLPTELQ